MTRALVALVAIVKDEAANIRATLDSTQGAVDAAVIVDTGSIDNTPAIVRDWFKETKIPGALYEEPFIPFEPLLPSRRVIDFARTRNRALELVEATRFEGRGKCPVFSLFLSGDEVLTNDEKLRSYLEEHRAAEDGAYAIELRSGNSRWLYPRILRTDAKWRYHDANQEVPRSPDGSQVTGPLVPEVYITHAVSDPMRRVQRMRDVDLPVLDHLANDESTPLDERAQPIWFLAQTHEAIADEKPRTPGGPWLSHKMAAMSLYWRRYELGGPDETKTNYALFRFLNVAEQIGLYGDEELLRRLQPLAQAQPKLPEVWYMIAAHAARLDARRGLVLAEEAAKVASESKGATLHVPTDGRVEWYALRLAAACAKELKLDRRARELAERAVAAGGPPDEFRVYLEAA